MLSYKYQCAFVCVLKCKLCCSSDIHCIYLWKYGRHWSLWSMSSRVCCTQHHTCLYKKGPWPIFILPLFHHPPLPPLHSDPQFFLQPLSINDPSLDVQTDPAMTQSLLNSPQDSPFPIHALNLFQSIVTSIPQHLTAPPLTLTQYQNIWFKVTAAVSRSRVLCRPPPKLGSIEMDIVFKYVFVFNTFWHGSNMFLCALALSALLLTHANIEM